MILRKTIALAIPSLDYSLFTGLIAVRALQTLWKCIGCEFGKFQNLFGPSVLHDSKNQIERESILR